MFLLFWYYTVLYNAAVHPEPQLLYHFLAFWQDARRSGSQDNLDVVRSEVDFPEPQRISGFRQLVEPARHE